MIEPAAHRAPQRRRWWLDEVLGRRHRRFIDLLVMQVRAAADGAELARVAVADRDAGAVRSAMAAIEHEGDAHRQQLVGELTRAFTTPLDREDVFRLSRAVDDVLDHLREFVREARIYAVADSTGLESILEILAAGVGFLERAIQGLADERDTAAEHSLRARGAGKGAQRRGRELLADLFALPVTSETMKLRELVDRLNRVAGSLAEAADVLADAIVKRAL